MPRTTLTIDEDVFELALRQAKARNQRIGQVVSELMRRGANVKIPIVKKNGLNVFAPPSDFPRVTADDVKRTLEDE